MRLLPERKDRGPTAAEDGRGPATAGDDSRYDPTKLNPQIAAAP
jgi:hypothetical protein